MAKWSFVLLGVFVLSCASEANDQLVRFFTQGTDGVLEKVKPQVEQISKLLATSTGQGTKDTEQLITDHITNDLGLFLEKLETLINKTQVNEKQRHSLEVGSELTVPINSWLESARNELQTSLLDLMKDITAGKSKCCTCLICKRKKTACFIPFCCAQGGKICKCITCSSGKGELIASMDSVNDSTGSTEGTQPALDHINSLIDSLLVLINYP